MLTIRKEDFRENEINVILYRLLPKNHIVRKIENAIDFSFIYDKVKNLYSPLGVPSIDPVVLIKIVLIQYLFGIPLMQTIREIELNVAYRWFLGYSLTEKIPHFSTFNKNYGRRFKNTDLFESIFKEILARATKCGFVDSTHITPGNIHYSVAFSDLYKKLKSNSKQHATAIDAGYITPYICKTILDDGIIPAIEYKRPMTKKGFFKKYEYVYDEYYDYYICPNNKILKYSTTNRDGYREYKYTKVSYKEYMAKLFRRSRSS